MLTRDCSPSLRRGRNCAAHLAPVLAAFLALAGACGPDGGDGGPSFVVADSAGVELVRTRADAQGAALHLHDPPLLRLGSDEADSPELFGQISSLHLAPDGSLWVSDLLSAELRVFSVPSGAHRFTVGGQGEGPGEFAMPFPVGFGTDGRAWIWDQRLGRVTTFGPGGELGEVSALRRGDFVPRVHQRLAGGSYVAQLPTAFAGAVTDGMILQDTVRLWEVDGDEEPPRLLAERQGAAWYYRDGIQTHVPFSEGTHFAVRGGRIVLSDPGGAPTLDVVEDGRLVRRIHVERPREPVTAAAVEGELGGGRRTEAAAALIRERVGELPLPAALPTWGWIRLGPRGHIFALRYGTLLSGEVWDVFEPDGRLAGTLSLQEDSHLMDVGEGLVAVLEMDALGLPGAAVFVLPGT